MKKASGGVVFDSRGHVLLRRPTNLYGGYAWTFPKGRVDKGETEEATALREVREESGVEARIVSRIPGEFVGDTTINVFFLMAVVADHRDFHWETEAVAWATPDAARRLISQTESSKGRERDLAVLDAAIAALVANDCGQSRT